MELVIACLFFLLISYAVGRLIMAIWSFIFSTKTKPPQNVIININFPEPKKDPGQELVEQAEELLNRAQNL